VGGASLHLRGYRVRSTPAPLRETLAAAMILASGWRADRPLVDPMCGSGTIAIEAALIAARVAPGLAAANTRSRRFGFERWPRFGDAEAAAWQRLRDEARAAALPRSPVPIIASDRDEDALSAARACLAAAAPAVAASIELRHADARELAPLDPPGVVISNPPYGERLAGGVESFYRALGARLRALDGHTAFLLVPPDAPRALGMRPTWQRRWKNGPLTVSLCRFELGRRRAGGAGAGSSRTRR
jgi:putative N6-adenine-specific DNA methylase